MAELSESEIITQLNAIDTQLATIRAALAGGTGAAQYTDYTIGNKTIHGSQQMEQLMKLREHYQGLLEKIPGYATDSGHYDVQPGTGSDESELIGDEA